MYLGVDYYPEQWVFPYGGTAENPEAASEHDADLMVKAGFNVVRIGEFSWGLCAHEEGKYDFEWLKRVMDIMAQREIKVVLGTPTAAPPLWLAKKHPQMLPVDENGLVRHEVFKFYLQRLPEILRGIRFWFLGIPFSGSDVCYP